MTQDLSTSVHCWHATGGAEVRPARNTHRMPLTRLELIEAFGSACDNRNAALFVGAGLSKAADLPDWEALLEGPRLDTGVPLMRHDFPLMAEYIGLDGQYTPARMEQHIINALLSRYGRREVLAHGGAKVAGLRPPPYGGRRRRRRCCRDVHDRVAAVDGGPRSSIGWLLRTSAGVIKNRSRSTRRRNRLTGRIALLNQATSAVQDSADAVVRRDEALRRLASLSEEQREALLLVTWDGLSPDEAATVLGLKPATFRKRVSRARELLDRDEAPPVATNDRPALPPAAIVHQEMS
jgi:predicted DNA-binding protein (UPF0251 family)